ncbi:hypothetical protein BDE02_05G093000 [Populus trichocarpa]|nr:hypothetical protein BDE02_05G093000 [Populus trichocarpa]
MFRSIKTGLWWLNKIHLLMLTLCLRTASSRLPNHKPTKNIINKKKAEQAGSNQKPISRKLAPAMRFGHC